MRGQLIEQHSDDEPASDLLKHIRAEKLHLVKQGKLKQTDSIVLEKAPDFPFPLPPQWAASTLQGLCISVTDGDHLPPPKTDRGVPFLVIGNVRSKTISFTDCRHVSEEYYQALDKIRRPQKGDLLYTLVGSYGIPIIVNDDRPFCVQRHSEWVNWEIEYAEKQGKRIVGVYAHGANDCDVPEALEKYADDVRGWNSDAVVEAILGERNEWREPNGELRDPRPIKRFGC